MEKLKENWALLNDFLATKGRSILARKVIDNLIIYSIYILLVLSISYASYKLIIDIFSQFSEHSNSESFPFILFFAEHLFLYFLPVFILFGFLNYYLFDLQRSLLQSPNAPDSRAEKSLHFSKKLFFSSVLSYTTIKIIEKLFFNQSKTAVNNTEFIPIGLFFLILIIFVLIQHTHKH